MICISYLFIVCLFPSPLVPPLERVVIIWDVLTARTTASSTQLTAGCGADPVTDIELCFSSQG